MDGKKNNRSVASPIFFGFDPVISPPHHPLSYCCHRLTLSRDFVRIGTGLHPKSDPNCRESAVISTIHEMKNAKEVLNSDNFEWPEIDYNRVASDTCKELSELLGAPKFRGHKHTIPKTPKKAKLVRKLRRIVSGRRYEAARRVDLATALEDDIEAHLQPIFSFLRAARRFDGERFNFPEPKATLVHSLANLKQSLAMVEELITENSDASTTESDTDVEFTGGNVAQ
ncbi:hypothetical protein B0H17DRAFT_1146771 [Mycena rosella]|uniref:Uncharacterized protein n=1 Tax=Mycena rosella TaxID=1033263 RepID=A0AAD7CN62_MYCRO|nr:hypothetical protein B0H17DRAFT_1146771 [Mycena rosella]